MKTEPKTLRGFKDSLPKEMVFKNECISKIKNVFESFCYLPTDTPIIEYSSVLLDSGEINKQVFRFKDNLKNDVTLRYDLTVPLAKLISKNYNELGMPFKRYQIGKVFRGENNQKGRFKEFYQCDFDYVGSDSPISDSEVIYVAYKTISKFINPNSFKIKINELNVVKEFLKTHSEDLSSLLVVLDKSIKKDVTEDLLGLNLTKQSVGEILEFVSFKGNLSESVDFMRLKVPQMSDYINNLEVVLSYLNSMGVPDSCLEIDFSIVRGLNYYTGIVFETFLNDLQDLGSVCSGGRYNKLTTRFSDLEVKCVGGSIGLDRLIVGMSELGLIKDDSNSNFLILNLDNTLLPDYIKLSNKLRNYGINNEIYPECKNMNKQFKYANRKGYRFVVINGDSEIKDNKINVKDLLTGESEVFDNNEFLRQCMIWYILNKTV